MRNYLIPFGIAAVLTVGGCTNMSATQQGTVSGGLIGAAGGAGIAAIAGGDAGVGAAVGALAGGAIGYMEGSRPNSDNPFRQASCPDDGWEAGPCGD